MNQLYTEGELLSPPASDVWEDLESPPTTPTLPHGGELPRGYGEDSIVLMAKDPAWLFAYWEITEAGWANCTKDLQNTQCQLILRILHLSHEDELPLGYFDITLPPFSEDWHVNTGRMGGRFRCPHWGTHTHRSFSAHCQLKYGRGTPGRATMMDTCDMPVFEELSLSHPWHDSGTSPTNW